jgi:hypothetical protein
LAREILRAGLYARVSTHDPTMDPGMAKTHQHAAPAHRAYPADSMGFADASLRLAEPPVYALGMHSPLKRRCGPVPHGSGKEGSRKSPPAPIQLRLSGRKSPVLQRVVDERTRAVLLLR